MLHVNLIMMAILSFVSILIIAIFISHLYSFMKNKEEINASLENSSRLIASVAMSSSKIKSDAKVISENVSEVKRKNEELSVAVSSTNDNLTGSINELQNYSKSSMDQIKALYDRFATIDRSFADISSRLNETKLDYQSSRNQSSNDYAYLKDEIHSLRNDMASMSSQYNVRDDSKAHGQKNESKMKEIEVLKDKINSVIAQHSSILEDIRAMKLSSPYNNKAIEIDERNSDISRDLHIISQHILSSNSESFDKAAFQEMFSDIIHKNHAIMNILLLIDVKIRKSEVKLSNLEGSLNNYFHFNDSVKSPDNIFERITGGISPELGFASLTRHSKGIVVSTPDGLLDDKNLRICNKKNNCINLNANDDGFNITPDNLNNLTINTKDKLPMARFDMQNSSVYLGGSDMNAPMFIKDNNLYVNNINMILKEPGTKITEQNAKDLPTIRLSGEDMNELRKQSQEIASGVMSGLEAVRANYEKNEDVYLGLANYGMQLLADKAETMNDFTIYYTLKNDYNAATKKLVSRFVFKILQTRRVKKGDLLLVSIYLQDIFGENKLPEDLSAADNTVKNINTSEDNLKLKEELFNLNHPGLIVDDAILILIEVEKDLPQTTMLGMFSMYLSVEFRFSGLDLKNMDGGTRNGTCNGKWMSKEVLDYMKKQ